MNPGPRVPGRRRGPPVGDTNVKNFRKAWSTLLNYMGPFRKWFILALVLAFVSTIISLIGPNLLSNMTDLIEDGIIHHELDMDAIAHIGYLLASLYIIGAVMMVVEKYVLATVTQRTASKLRTDISHKINRMPLRYFDRTTTGDMLSRVTNDVDTIGQSLNQSMSTLVTVVATLVGSVFMMFYTTSWIGRTRSIETATSPMTRHCIFEHWIVWQGCAKPAKRTANGMPRRRKG